MRSRWFCLFTFAALGACAEERVPITGGLEGIDITGGAAYTSGTRGQFVEPEPEAEEAEEAQTAPEPQREDPAMPPVQLMLTVDPPF